MMTKDYIKHFKELIFLYIFNYGHFNLKQMSNLNLILDNYFIYSIRFIKDKLHKYIDEKKFNKFIGYNFNNIKFIKLC